MNNPFIHPEAIDNGVEADKFAAVYETNKAKGLKAQHDLGKTTLEDAIQVAVDISTEADATTQAIEELDSWMLEDQEKAALVDAFIGSKELFGRVGTNIPSVKEFVEAGVDLPLLTSIWKHWEAEGLDPEVIIAPNYSVDQWESLYENLVEAGEGISGNPLKYDDDYAGYGLFFADEVKENWDVMDKQLFATSKVTDKVTGLQWTVSVVVGKKEAPDKIQEYRPGWPAYPTPSEYLTLQARRVTEKHGDMVDVEGERCWLSGSVINQVYGVTGCFFDDGLVTISLADKNDYPDNDTSHRRAQR